MTDSIVSPAMNFDRGVAAFEAGRLRNSHNMNPWAPALPDWQAGWDYAQQKKYDRLTKRQAEVVVEGSPP